MLADLLPVVVAVVVVGGGVGVVGGGVGVVGGGGGGGVACTLLPVADNRSPPRTLTGVV